MRGERPDNNRNRSVYTKLFLHHYATMERFLLRVLAVFALLLVLLQALLLAPAARNALTGIDKMEGLRLMEGDGAVLQR